MKKTIQLKDIEQNPHRDFKRDPIQSSKVARLVKTIKDDEFWGGLKFRPHPTKKGKYQSAFGHHRIASLKKAGYKEVAGIVQEMSDAKMLRLMVDENRERWDDMTPTEKIQTVRVVRDYINAEIAKYDTWEAFHTECAFSMKDFFASNSQFQKCKKSGGAGRQTILKYFDRIQEWDVQRALAILDAETEHLNFDTVKEFDNMFQLDEFRKSVKAVPKIEQKKLAKETAKIVSVKKIGGRDLSKVVDALTDDKLDPETIDILDSMNDVEEFRRAVHLKNVAKAKQKKIAKSIVEGGDCIDICATVIEQAEPKSNEKPKDLDVAKAERLIKNATDALNKATITVSELHLFMEELGVIEAKGLHTVGVGVAWQNLRCAMRTIMKGGQKEQNQKLLVE